MPAHVLAPLAFAIPLLVAAALAATGRWLPRWATDGAAALAAATAVGMSAALLVGARHGRLVVWVGAWVPHHGHSAGIVLVVDQVGAGLALLVSVLVLASLIYSWRYFESVEALFHALMLLFLAGMTGFCLSGDLFDMFVFFELMGAVAYALTGHQVEEPQSVQGALHFGVINSLGAYFSLTGIALLYARTGELGLAQIGHELAGHHADPLVIASFVLVATGFLVKAAAVPFHFWLADAHAVAPSPVCVLFSGVMVELGVYAVARIYWVVFAGTLPAPAFRLALLVLGTAGALLGGVLCLAQHHLKRLLAYSTISHVGLFLLGVAALTPDGLAGAGLYVVGHAGVKASLFLATGVLLDRFGTVDERELHAAGRRARLHVVGATYVIGGLALAGLPPFGAFIGKSVTEDALSKGGAAWTVAMFTIASALTGGAVLRAALRIFAGVGARPAEAERRSDRHTEEPETGVRLRRLPATMGAATVGLLASGLVTGVIPGVATAFDAAAEQFVDGAGYAADALHGARSPISPGEAVTAWTSSGIAFSAIPVVLAVLCAVAALWIHRVPDAMRGLTGRICLPPLRVLHRVHSGHVGDYVAWLVLGVAILAGLVALRA